jgi:hypothetical protein
MALQVTTKRATAFGLAGRGDRESLFDSLVSFLLRHCRNSLILKAMMLQIMQTNHHPDLCGARSIVEQPKEFPAKLDEKVGG